MRVCVAISRSDILRVLFLSLTVTSLGPDYIISGL